MTLPNYEELLTRAKEVLPDIEENAERFQIPKVKGHIQGVKTVISNMNQIADTLGRPIKHLLKFLTREMASTAEQVKTLVIFGSKVSAAKINEKIEDYANEFVICKECSKPDTKLTKEGDIYYFKCQACGARYTFTSKI
jgi:translation initiation factor 2 subunit 2